MNALQREANKYLRARQVLDDLRRYDNYLSYAEYKAIRKQALEGDQIGAIKKLGQLLLERRCNDGIYAGMDKADR